MHTSSSVYHRLYFKNICTSDDSFTKLINQLDLQNTDRPDVFDLCFDEGSTLTVFDAIYQVFPTGRVQDDPTDYSIEQLQYILGKLAETKGVNLHSDIFSDTSAITGDLTNQIGADALFDLINTVSSGYELIGIYSEWIIVSNKPVYGANSGGAIITTRQFMLPTTVDGDEAEAIIQKFSCDRPEELGDYYVDKFIRPRLDGVVEEPFKNAIFDAILRMTTKR